MAISAFSLLAEANVENKVYSVTLGEIALKAPRFRPCADSGLDISFYKRLDENLEF